MDICTGISIDVFVDMFINISTVISIDILIGVSIDMFVETFIYISTRRREEEGRKEGVDFFLKSNNPNLKGGETSKNTEHMYSQKNRSSKISFGYRSSRATSSAGASIGAAVWYEGRCTQHAQHHSELPGWFIDDSVYSAVVGW